MGDITDKAVLISTAGITLTSGSEGTVLTLNPGGTLAFDEGLVCIHCYAQVLPDTAATNLTSTLYRGSGTGGTAVITSFPSRTDFPSTGRVEINFDYVEQRLGINNAGYTWTITPTTTGGTGTVQQAVMTIEIIN